MLFSRRDILFGLGAGLFPAIPALASQRRPRIAFMSYGVPDPRKIISNLEPVGGPEDQPVVSNMTVLDVATGQQKRRPIRTAGHMAYALPGTSRVLVCPMHTKLWALLDADSMDVVAIARSEDGWYGGGHGILAPDNILLCAERPDRKYSTATPENHGRIVIRDSMTLKTIGVFSSHGLLPHDLRLHPDGKSLVIANYGSIASQGRQFVPDVRDSCITIVDIASGKLLEKLPSANPDAEIRHVEVSRDQIFSLQTLSRPKGHPDLLLPGVAETESYPQNSRDGSYAGARVSSAPLSGGRLDYHGSPENPASNVHAQGGWFDEALNQVLVTIPGSGNVQVYDGRSGEFRTLIDLAATGCPHPTSLVAVDETRYAVLDFVAGVHFIGRHSLQVIRKDAMTDVYLGGNSHASPL